MAVIVNRSIEARSSRIPDFFLSYSSRDREIIWQLADDLPPQDDS